MSHESNNQAQRGIASLILVEKSVSLLSLAAGGLDPLSNNAIALALSGLRGIIATNKTAAPVERVKIEGDPGF